MAGITAVIVVVGALYWRVTELWWLWDDVYLLHVATVRSASDHLLSRELWRSLGLVMPLLTASYDAGFMLFGPDARAFYLLHLAEIALLAVVLQLTLRLWLPSTSAFAGALLFAVGVPVCGLVTHSSSMHFTLALIFGTGATAVYAIGVRRDVSWLNIASACFYLAGMLAREFAVPVPLLLLLLPEGGGWRRIRPHLAALAVYVIWRTTMLGALVGGYGFAVTSDDVLPLVLRTPLRMLGTFAGPDLLVGSLLIVVLVIGLGAGLRERGFAWRAGVALVVSIAPFLPAAKTFELRYGAVPWLAVSVLFVLACSRRPVRTQRALLAVAVMLAVIANRQQWSIEFARATRQSAEARAFFDLAPGDLLAFPTIPPAAIAELRWLKEDWLRRPAGAGWFYDEIFVCAGRASGQRIVAWNDQRRAVEETAVDPRCGAVREAPLALTFQHRGEQLFWSFGPYRDGRWSVVMDEGRQAFAVPGEDGFRLPGVEQLALQVRYDSPEGWRTYSPVIALDFARTPDLTFER